MGYEFDVPDANKGATPQQLYDWIYNGGSYGRQPSEWEIREKGWDRYIDNGRVFWDTTNKDLRVNPNFLSQEKNSGDALIGIGRIRFYETNDSLEMARLQEVAGDSAVRGGPITLKTTPPVSTTVAGGAGLAPAVTLVALVAGKELYLEAISLGVLSATVSATGLVTVKDSVSGNILWQGTVTSICSSRTFLSLAIPGTAGEALTVEIDAAGPTTFANGDVLYAQPYYREL